jgi:hypothetical protein
MQSRRLVYLNNNNIKIKKTTTTTKKPEGLGCFALHTGRRLSKFLHRQTVPRLKPEMMVQAEVVLALKRGIPCSSKNSLDESYQQVLTARKYMY